MTDCLGRRPDFLSGWLVSWLDEWRGDEDGMGHPHACNMRRMACKGQTLVSCLLLPSTFQVSLALLLLVKFSNRQ